jgi:hypothetical protein
LKRLYLLIIVIAVFSIVVATPGCSKKHNSSRPGISGDTGGGTGSGGGGSGGGSGGSSTGDTVPGNTDLGLAISPEAPRYSGGGTADEMMVAEMINDFREEQGLNRLTWSDELADAERSHAYDCNQFKYGGHGNHKNPSYSIAVERGKSLGLYRLYECTTHGTGGPANAINAWTNSSGHRAAILKKTLSIALRH